MIQYFEIADGLFLQAQAATFVVELDFQQRDKTHVGSCSTLMNFDDENIDIFYYWIDQTCLLIQLI